MEDLKARTCANCACVYRVEPARVLSPEQLRSNPGLDTLKVILICRLNPPVFLPDGKGGTTLAQMPTKEYMSCWWWKAPGTLPGDLAPPSTVKVLA